MLNKFLLTFANNYCYWSFYCVEFVYFVVSLSVLDIFIGVYIMFYFKDCFASFILITSSYTYCQPIGINIALSFGILFGILSV